MVVRLANGLNMDMDIDIDINININIKIQRKPVHCCSPPSPSPSPSPLLPPPPPTMTCMHFGVLHVGLFDVQTNLFRGRMFVPPQDLDLGWGGAEPPEPPPATAGPGGRTRWGSGHYYKVNIFFAGGPAKSLACNFRARQAVGRCLVEPA